MKDKKKIILSILGILLLVLATIGVTFAVFTYTKLGTTENTVTTGTLKFLYTENTGVGNGINIENAFPVSDEVGKGYNTDKYVFDFSVEATNSGVEEIPYEVTLRKKDTSTLSESNVKVYLTDMTDEADTAIVSPTLYSDLTQTTIDVEDEVEKTIYNGTVLGGELTYKKDFRLRMWIDEKSNQDDINGKTFTALVNVYSNVPLVSEEELNLRNNTDISNISALGSNAVLTDNKDYNYELGLPTGTTSINLDIATKNDNTKVEIEKVDTLASLSNNSVRRIASSNNLQLTEGNNYFKITTTSQDKQTVTTSLLNVHVGSYSEDILNGTDPILNKLVPVVIDGKGTVQKVDTNYTWYSYSNKEWANAVILKDETKTYSNGEIIPESNIESYFVWIPKYSYKLWDLGNYTSVTTASSKQQEIKIKFGTTNTSNSVTGECATPKTTGASGNCGVGEYMTHPAFLVFNTNGFWVGKFETGYDGATTYTEANINNVNTSKIIIKPNVYSWRNITVGKMFKNSYDYERDLDSHMMKNTEWGAVAYLSHSNYGTCENGKCTEVRINNNRNYITGYSGTSAPTCGYSSTSIACNRFEGTSLGINGTYTKAYNTETGYLASTTKNISGIYDMSGGSWEYVMGYASNSSNEGASSGIISLYSDFFTNSKWNKYYDKYTADDSTDYNSRILGDATGELGPFEKLGVDDSDTTVTINSWYGDWGHMAEKDKNNWFIRGNYYIRGIRSGIFAHSSFPGGNSANFTYRIVLTPTN